MRFKRKWLLQVDTARNHKSLLKDNSMRLLEQAGSRVASGVNDSKSAPLDQQRSESSNAPLGQASLDFQKAFPGLS